MLKPRSQTSFYFDNKLIDVEMLKYEIRNCGAGLIHKKNQAVCKLSVVASDLYEGYGWKDESEVRKWLSEI